MGETTITRRDKVFWEKESQMKGRRCSISHPSFLIFLDFHKKTQTWLKCEKHVDISSIDYFLCVCWAHIIFKRCIAGFWHLCYKLKTANISRQNIGFCASSAIWASLVSFIIRLLLVQPSFSSSLGHKRPPVRSTWSVNINKNGENPFHLWKWKVHSFCTTIQW